MNGKEDTSEELDGWTGGGILSSKAAETFQPILNKFDQLRRIFKHDREIRLPTIVVIGDQSHGKSSLLETISGVELPKGKGMKTKLPLELQMRRLGEDEKEEYAVIECPESAERGSGLSGRESDDITGMEVLSGLNGYEQPRIRIDQIADEIDKITAKVAGTGQTVKDQPIFLTVYRKDMVDLTLVDLPGLVRNVGRSKGRDPKLPEKIRDMVQRYITNKEAIILNVLNCSVDAETCESLAMAAHVDPRRERTILAFTFVDQHMDEGLLEKFKAMQSEHGFPQNQIYLTRNRKEEENKKGVTLREVQMKEAAFFEKGSRYLAGLPSACKGSSRLQQQLAEMQKKKILDVLPELRRIIDARHEDLCVQDKHIGDILSNETEYLIRYQSLVNKFVQKLRESVDGFSASAMLSSSGLREKCVCAEGMNAWIEFDDKIRELMPLSRFFSQDFFQQLKELRDATHGFRALPDAMHPHVAVSVIRDLSTKLNEPTKDLVRRVKRVMEIQAQNIIDELFQEFPVLQSHVSREFKASLRAKEALALDRAVERLTCYRDRPSTRSPDYERVASRLEQIIGDPNYGKTQEDDEEEYNRNATKDPAIIRVRGCGYLDGLYQKQATQKNHKPWYKSMVGKLKIYFHPKAEQWVFVREGDRSGRPDAYVKAVPGKSFFYAAQNGTVLALPSVAESSDSGDDMDVEEDSDAKSGPKSEFQVLADARVESVMYDAPSLAEERDFLEVLNTDLVSIHKIQERIRAEAARIAAYWRVLTRHVIDEIPLCVLHHVVDGCISDTHQDTLFRAVLGSTGRDSIGEQLQVLMKPDGKRVRKKAEVVKNLGKVEEFKVILNQIEDLSMQ